MDPDNSGSGNSVGSGHSGDSNSREVTAVDTREIKIEKEKGKGIGIGIEIGIRKKMRTVYIPDCLKGKCAEDEYFKKYFQGVETRNMTFRTAEGKRISITVPSEIKVGDEAKVREYYRQAYKSYYYHYRNLGQSPRGKKGDNK